ncbi:MAG: hypothetical protein ABI674_06275 [Spartobacteria bacterium]
MKRVMIKLLPLALSLLFAGQAMGHDAAVSAIASLIDPAKLATLSGDRAANQRVLKCVFWLNDARSRGMEPEAVIDQAQTLNESAQQSRAPLVEAALLRNLDIAEKLGCLTSENLDRMRHGRSPLISRGPYVGEPAEIDHIIPLAVEPALRHEIANLELLPRTLNRRKGASMGERQRDCLRKFRQANLIELVPDEGDASPLPL